MPWSQAAPGEEMSAGREQQGLCWGISAAPALPSPAPEPPSQGRASPSPLVFVGTPNE